jgi:putative DNA primase/helicase
MLVTAPAVSGAGSGKGLLVRAISAIAFGIHPRAFTTGSERQELDKRLAAELVEAQPFLFLDNANGIALRSDTLASVLTERPARVRLLGQTRMVPLNSTAFIAVTGNGLTVTEDLARRFILCELDAHCEDPEQRSFPAGFLDQIVQRRVELLVAALTIWRWGRQNGAGLARGKPLGSFETWAEWCRDPLVTLGCRDPVERIEALKASDPRRQQIAELLRAWWEHHGSTPVKATQLDESVKDIADPQKRGRHYLARFLAGLAGTRAAGFVLTRQAPAGKWSAATYALIQAAPAGPDKT